MFVKLGFLKYNFSGLDSQLVLSVTGQAVASLCYYVVNFTTEKGPLAAGSYNCVGCDARPVHI